jgi:hypothetical protein
MISLDEVTKNWDKDGIWKIAPAGVPWIKEGNRVTLGDGVTLGNWVTLGDWVMMGDGVTLGDWVRLGDGVTLGDGVRLGDGVTLGPRCGDAVDLGWADGYRKCIANVGGVAWIGAGCRWFTLSDALNHWENKPDREMTMCLMMSAIHIAALRGWKHGDES